MLLFNVVIFQCIVNKCWINSLNTRYYNNKKQRESFGFIEKKTPDEKERKKNISITSGLLHTKFVKQI